MHPDLTPTAPMGLLRPTTTPPTSRVEAEIVRLRAEIDRATALAADVVTACDRLAVRITEARIALGAPRA